MPSKEDHHVVGVDGSPDGWVAFEVRRGMLVSLTSHGDIESLTATFPGEGSFVLRLTADDGALQASSDVTITVAPAGTNQPPVVDAGPEQSLVFPATATSLEGSVSDDGLPIPPGIVSGAEPM